MNRLPNIISLIFIVAIVVVTGVALRKIDTVPASAPLLPSDKEVIADYNKCLTIATANGALDPKVLQKCGDELAKSGATDYGKGRMDELRWMLTLIGSLAAFFAIAQGASAYFSAQNYSKAADEAIKRITDQEASVRARYPLFSVVEQARHDAYSDLRQALKHASKVEDPNADPLEALVFMEHFYGQMPVEQRQRLLSVESFASLDLDPAGLGDEDYAKDLVRLAVFYQSKFLFEDESGKSALADLDRAENYLRLAQSKSKGDFSVNNELGYLYLIFHKVLPKKLPASVSVYLDKAIKEFETSIAKEPRQQRAHYNLGVIHGKHRKDFPLAIQHLTRASLHPNWQRVPVSYTKSFVYYNLGCYHARLLGATANRPLTVDDAKTIFYLFGESSKIHRIPESNLKHDFEEANGDVYDMFRKADATLQTEIQCIRKKLAEDIPIQAGLVDAVKESYALIRKALFPR